jgi:signal transduction histidine kinase
VATKRVRKGEMFDSAYGSPQLLGPATKPASRQHGDRSPDSSHDIEVEDVVVAVDISSAPMRARVLEVLASRKHVVAGPDLLPAAAVVILDSPGDVRARLADVRRRCRPDASLIVVLGQPTAASVASAYAAGAVACVRPPLVPEELLGYVSSALDSRAARGHAADLARKLDLETHLASLGRFTAGLSHEIGNPLNVATMNMQLITADIARLFEVTGLRPDSMPDLRDAIADTTTALARLTRVLETMRSLVRKNQGVALGSLDALELVQNVRKWLTEELRGVEVEVLGSSLGARADADMLGQILHNLIANAANAARTLPSPRLRLHVYESGDHVVISVRDNGPGIPPEMHDKVFEPFFTTRRSQGGTGLGLALCLEYAQRIDAELSFWSVPGRGTCFRVALQRV